MNKKHRLSTAYIVIHCSDTPAWMNIGARDIDQWHRRQGWRGIGYHYVIRRNGRVEFGRPETQPGAHALHYNHRSIGVCLVGGQGHRQAPQNNFSQAQFASLQQLVHQLKQRYPKARVVGHGQLNQGRACPSFNVRKWLKTNRLV